MATPRGWSVGMAKAGLKPPRLSGGKTMPHLRCGGGVCGFFVRALRVATQQSSSFRPTSLLKCCCSGDSWMCSTSLMLSSLLLHAWSTIWLAWFEAWCFLQRACFLYSLCHAHTPPTGRGHLKWPSDYLNHQTF